MKKFKLTSKNVILIITYIAILVTGIIFKQPFYRILPLFISVIVMALQASANRFGYLLGGINALIYTVVYIHLGAYATAISGAVFSFPMQELRLSIGISGLMKSRLFLRKCRGN